MPSPSPGRAALSALKSPSDQHATGTPSFQGGPLSPIPVADPETGDLRVVFVMGRWQPVHAGHVALFRHLLTADPSMTRTSEDALTLQRFRGAQLVIGVASFSHQDAANPWSVGSRRQLIQWALKQALPDHLRRVTVEHFEVSGGPAAEAVGLHARVFANIRDRLYVTGNPNTAEAYKAGGLPYLQVDLRTTSGTAVRKLLVAGQYDQLRHHLLPGELDFMERTGMVSSLVNISHGG